MAGLSAFSALKADHERIDTSSSRVADRRVTRTGRFDQQSSNRPKKQCRQPSPVSDLERGNKPPRGIENAEHGGSMKKVPDRVHNPYGGQGRTAFEKPKDTASLPRVTIPSPMSRRHCPIRQQRRQSEHCPMPWFSNIMGRAFPQINPSPSLHRSIPYNQSANSTALDPKCIVDDGRFTCY
jgi:hypothetical protein